MPCVENFGELLFRWRHGVKNIDRGALEINNFCYEFCSSMTMGRQRGLSPVVGVAVAHHNDRSSIPVRDEFRNCHAKSRFYYIKKVSSSS